MPKQNLKSHAGKNSGFGRALIRKQRKVVGSDYSKYDRTNPDVHDEDTNMLKSVVEMGTLDEFMSHATLAKRDFQTKRGKMIISGQSEVQEGSELQEEEKDEIDRESVDNDDDELNLNEVVSVEPVDLDISHLAFPIKPAWNDNTTAEEYNRLETESFCHWRRQLSKIESNLSCYSAISPYERNLNIWREFWHVTDRSDIIVEILDSRDPLYYHCDALSTRIHKKMLIIMNKAELLSTKQVEYWRQYWTSKNYEVLFYSALNVLNQLDVNTPLMTCLTNQGVRSIGIVGYPNVGKSSVLRSLLTSSSAVPSVSDHPGHTRHLNSYKLTADLTLIDCPGLVLPKLHDNPLQLLLHNASSVNNSRVLISACKELTRLVSPSSLMALYHTSDLDTYCLNRGYTCGRLNQANLAMGAKEWIFDYLNGRLLFNHAPPDLNADQVADYLNETDLIMSRRHPTTFKQAVVHLADLDAPYAMGDMLVDEDKKQRKKKSRDQKGKKLWGKAKRWAEAHDHEEEEG